MKYLIFQDLQTAQIRNAEIWQALNPPSNSETLYYFPIIEKPDSEEVAFCVESADEGKLTEAEIIALKTEQELQNLGFFEVMP